MTDVALSQDVLFELTGVGVVETDLRTGRLVRANRTFCEWVGYSEAELRGMTNAELTHPDDWERDARAFVGLQRGETSRAEALTRCLRKDGRVVWLELHVTLLKEGDAVTNLTVVNNVTERVRAEAALRELNETLERRVAERSEALEQSERRFTRAFFANPIPACMTTRGEETFIEVNDAFLRLTGYAREEVVGQTVFELGMWSSRNDQRKLGEALADGRGFYELDLHLLDKGGGAHDILLSAEPVPLGGLEGYLKMFYDVTERKESEALVHRAIQEVMNDASWFGQRVMERLAHVRAGSGGPYEPVELSKREREVLERLAQGKNNDQIGKELGVATQTVRN